MKKFYLAKSTYTEKNTSDVLINLEKILTIRTAKEEGFFVIQMDYTARDQVNILVNTEEEMRAELKNILTAMGEEEPLHEKIKPRVKSPDSSKEEFSKLLTELAKAVK